MITLENIKTEIDKQGKAGLLDKEAVDLKSPLLEVIPYIDDAPEVKKEVKLSLKALNENLELNQKAKGIKSAGSDDSEAKKKKLKLIKIRENERLRLLMLKDE